MCVQIVWIVSVAWHVNFELILCRLFPGLKKAIYLDSDVVVQHDIHDFWSKLQTSNKIVTAVKRYGVHILYIYVAHGVPTSIYPVWIENGYGCLLVVQEHSILWRHVCFRGEETVQTEVGN